ncbi:MAG: NAD-glutamate dehydrogenase [Phycisphaerales bacterium]|nr:NAD-glutamate dehydrogenase [Phycisphaerales bacterium]
MGENSHNPTPDIAGAQVDTEAVIDQLTSGLRSHSEQVVPWFLEQMPPMYFQDTDEDTRLVHLRAIIAARASGRPIEMTLRSEDGSQWTSMRPLDYPGVLAELVAELPTDQPLRTAKIHTAQDGSLVLDTFEFGDSPRCDLEDPAQQEKRTEILAYAQQEMPDWTPEQITDFLERCSADYVLTLTPLRMAKHYEMYRKVTGTDGAAITLEPEADPLQSRISIAVGNSTRRTMLERIADRLSHSAINIHRAYLDTIADGDNGTITILGFVVQGPEGAIDPDGALWGRVEYDLRRIKWVHQRSIDLSRRHEALDLTHAELFEALCDLVHQRLLKINRYAFTAERIRRLAEENIELSLAVCDLFLDRFNPHHPLDDTVFDDRSAAIRSRFDDEVDLEDARTILKAMLTATTMVLKTNIYVDGRYALAMRLDPQFLQSEDRPDVPFGVFFVHGRGSNGFHVRFRNIARGGIRAIIPRSAAQHAREAERLYDEAWGLAQAQQLKNKDIPEGGSKAAVLVAPGARADRAVKGFVDSLLDLITPDEKTTASIVDRLGERELLYLGPDENITPALIDWIVDRAQRRGYPVPTALMSSKPGAGINHKEYGVTSEGVAVFLEVGLNAIGIDPRKQTFTVKLTGGPDGDVGGNLIRILVRDFGKNVRFVGIADGSGSAECPDGLDHEELHRLVEAGLPIAEFNPERLPPSGRVTSLDETDGVRLRNSLHNRVVADAFVPCGGRPATIHERNWREFLRPDGSSSSRIVVEGANLFLTPQARSELAAVGTLIFKDSSANKCGVICSSYEIIASMMLTTEEFLAIKPRFVPEVLAKLRSFARREAQLLVRLHCQQCDVQLPEMSIRLSRSVIRTADAIEPAIGELTGDDLELMRDVVHEHLPASLLEIAEDRLHTHIPETYLMWMAAKSLAARLVYREGIDPLEKMSTDTMCSMAMDFLRMEQERDQLAAELDASTMANGQRIAAILRQTGILSTMNADDESVS